MVKKVNTADLKSAATRLAGSSPARGTIEFSFYKGVIMTKYYLAFDPSAIVDMRIDDAAMVSDDKKYFYSFFEEEKESSHFVFVEFDIDLQSIPIASNNFDSENARL